jgi:hypothetical protein
MVLLELVPQQQQQLQLACHSGCSQRALLLLLLPPATLLVHLSP